MTARTESGLAIVAAGDRSSVHFLGSDGPASFTERRAPRIACGRAVSDPVRWTRNTRRVTCDECRMSRLFAQARRAR